ncbi:endonuclease VII domain-containing protein [Pseudonocardia sp. NPDC049154]|uniref:endonuclease VII domain-containing protein n=1 Tax=Pseudonocardia sp. NPDC049154 TaxID=3155501 RepID=UPI0033C91A0D
MAGSRRRACKGCGSTTRRLDKPGPRCASCHRDEVDRRREASWIRHIWQTYRLTAVAYWLIYVKQGGACAICQRAKGRPQFPQSHEKRRKRLAVDHDHRCCPTTPTCGKCTRGLCCTTCNKRVLGHFRDDPEAFLRGAEYLRNPPAKGIVDGAGEASEALERDPDRG